MSNDHEHLFAFPKQFRGVEAAVRFSAVKRWHMIATSGNQTLSEHSGNVALLVLLITRTAPDMFFGPSAPATCAALVHDIGEVFVGDIPTPTKSMIKSEVDAIEDAVTPSVYKVEVPPEVKKLIKLVDLADGIRYIFIHRIGSTGYHALKGLEDQYHKLLKEAHQEWPPVVYSHVAVTLTEYIYEQLAYSGTMKHES